MTSSRRALRPMDAAILAAVALVCALVLGVVGGALGLGIVGRVAPADDGLASASLASRTPQPRPPDTIAGVAQAALPSVVSVVVDAGFESGSGSGFVVQGGYVVTNNHVIESAIANQGRVEAILADGTRVPATVVGRNASYDVAVLRLKGAEDSSADLVPLTPSDADVAVGDGVIAIGAPLGLDFTVTTGIVSAVDRPVTVGEDEDRSYISAIQTDAAINPGNSGGPLLDGTGHFLGMTSAIATLAYGAPAGNIGVGFAIPARAVQRIADEIIATGSSRTPILGITIDPRFEGTGALIDEVTADGPARAAGLRPGDIVVRFGDRAISDGEELVVAIRDRLPGETVAIEVMRSGRPVTLRATLEGREDR